MTLRIAATAVLAALLATCAGEDLARAQADAVPGQRLESAPVTRAAEAPTPAPRAPSRRF